MATPLINLPGYMVNEYKIILTPHDDLAGKIMTIQKDFIEKFKIEYKAVYLPQLILVTFKQIQAFEQRIINRLEIVGMGFHPIKIELKDFGSFPSHTIFINVASNNGITELVRKIREDSQRLMKLDAENKPHFIMDAHLTIARKLKPWQYESGWLEYSHHHFTGRFIASKMILLRKKQGEYKFKPIASFDFKNLPVDIKQGELFR
jgi:2'-5' RNA ligase